MHLDQHCQLHHHLLHHLYRWIIYIQACEQKLATSFFQSHPTRTLPVADFAIAGGTVNFHSHDIRRSCLCNHHLFLLMPDIDHSMIPSPFHMMNPKLQKAHVNPKRTMKQTSCCHSVSHDCANQNHPQETSSEQDHAKSHQSRCSLNPCTSTHIGHVDDDRPTRTTTRSITTIHTSHSILKDQRRQQWQDKQ